MTWLSWRQLRAQAASTYAAVVAAAVVLAITGPRLLDLARADGNVFDRLSGTDRGLFYGGIVIVALVPALIGAFWGAPLVARELEAGTHRLVWNQSVTRTRWLAAKLGTTTLAAAAAVGGLTLAASWWARPIDGATSSTRGGLPSRLTPVAFAMRGVAPIGYTVFALMLGVTLGVLLRRSLPAMALTLAVFAAVQVAVPLWVRPHLVSPVSQSVTFSRDRLDSIMADANGRPLRVSVTTGGAGDWVLSNQTVDAGGHAAALPSWMADCLPPPPTSAAVVRPAAPDVQTCLARLTSEGYRQRIAFQPADRFWALQWRETAMFLVLSGLLAWLCFWWTRHRLS